MIARVSSMRSSHPASKGSNTSAALCRCGRVVAGAVLLLFVATSAGAQQTSAAQSSASENGAVDIMKFLAGGLLGLGLHESGHLVFDAVFDAQPHVKAVHFGPFPFFAIAHRSNLTPRREFTVSSAGFWVQEVGSEWLLTGRPAIRDDRVGIIK